MSAATASRCVAVAEMPKPAINIAVELARLGELTIFELRREWRRLHRMPPPMRLSRELLIRGMTYKFQEKALGGLSKSIIRNLESVNVKPSDARKTTPPISLKPGTRLIREWRGATHTMLVHTDGVEWKGRRYRSLTIIAREITGARWSGPRFFGLRKRLSSSAKSADGEEHAEA